MVAFGQSPINPVVFNQSTPNPGAFEQSLNISDGTLMLMNWFDLKKPNTDILSFDIFPNLTISNEIYVLKATSNSSVKGLNTIDNKNIQFLPVNISTTFPGLFALRFKNCSISKIDSTNFHRLNLQLLDISFNKIKSLDVDTFLELKELKVLKINNNLITSLDKKIFSNLNDLYTLSIQENFLGKLHKETLASLTQLETLNINKIGVTVFNGDELEKNTKMLSILMKDNGITKLSPKLFANKTQLIVVNLQGNKCINQSFNSASQTSNLNHMIAKIQKDCTGNGSDKGKIAFGSVLMILISMMISGF